MSSNDAQNDQWPMAGTKNSYKGGGGATGNKVGPNAGTSSEGEPFLQEQSGKQDGVNTTGNHNKG
jgi:hypothetical protein